MPWFATAGGGGHKHPGNGGGLGQAEIRGAGQPIKWDDFWTYNSPWLVNGTARIRFNQVTRLPGPGSPGLRRALVRLGSSATAVSVCC